MGVAAVVVGGVALAAPERITLKNGKVLVGEVTEKGDALTVKPAEGPAVKVLRTDVEKRSVLSPKEQYEVKRKGLKPDDVRGMFALARWCRFNKLAAEAVALCQQILEKDPQHVGATKLMGQLEGIAPASRPGGAGVRPGGIVDRSKLLAPLPRRLTREEVKRVRLLEMRRTTLEDPPMRGRIGPKALTAFLDEMRGEKGFETDREQRDFRGNAFNNQMQQIMELTGTKYIDKHADQINISTDPQATREFQRRIQSTILKGCASVKCHGGRRARAFRLLASANSPEAWYTNFLILDSYIRENLVSQPGEAKKTKSVSRMIDRRKPENSLLLNYCLPTKETDIRHPPLPSAYNPLFNRDSDLYDQMFEWIQMLQVPHPKYNLKWDPTKPAKQRGEADKAPRKTRKP